MDPWRLWLVLSEACTLKLHRYARETHTRNVEVDLHADENEKHDFLRDVEIFLFLDLTGVWTLDDMLINVVKDNDCHFSFFLAKYHMY